MEAKDFRLPIITGEDLIDESTETEIKRFRIEDIDPAKCFDAPLQENLDDVEIELVEAAKEMALRLAVEMKGLIYSEIEKQPGISLRNVKRIFEVLEESGKDLPKIIVRFGDEAVDMIKSFGVAQAVDTENIKNNGLVLFQLPEPLAKYWYRKNSGDLNMIEWGSIYEKAVNLIWNEVYTSQQEGLPLARKNPLDFHDPKNFYYLFSFSEDEENFQPNARRFNSASDFQDVTGLDFKETVSNPEKHFWLGPNMPMVRQIENVVVDDQSQIGEISANNSIVSDQSIDLMISPYLISSLNLTDIRTNWDDLFGLVNRVLSDTGKAHFVLRDSHWSSVDGFDPDLFEQALAKYSIENGGRLRSKFESMGEHDMLTIWVEERNENPLQDLERLSKEIKYAIADAMVIGYAYETDVNHDRMIDIPEDVKNEEDFDTWIASISYARCLQNSAGVIEHLATTHPNKFEKMFLIKRHDSKGVDKKYRKNFGDHTVFVIKGRDGKWYAGSPANSEEVEEVKRRRRGDKNFMTTTYEADSLKKLLHLLELNEGYYWGKPEDYDKELYISPRVITEAWKAYFSLSIYLVGDDRIPKLNYKKIIT
ncbi:MAG: hypothetical protein UV68_C0010G0003 [Candidatus Collierbacteria bacterium GW2011_GWC2_43_12]|uniref:Uncharacterized protein n=1 Tax=Candidatus Collierbacteria bacterium GW2011_GWC2_43_12 TaxID=1618390 RepID=A0A0G1G679_9BACT|nr:MAG: hypothetical protein UV68_C0010G0003 [Candidatus Collierbacteria bacterium GW2011_GWC2_43_12]